MLGNLFAMCCERDAAAGTRSLLNSIFLKSCRAPFWTLPGSQRQMSSHHKPCGMRTRGAVVGAEGVAVVGMEAVEAGGVLLLMQHTAC